MPSDPKPGPGQLTHVDTDGTARMVDVSHKPPTHRRARARAVVQMAAETADAIRQARVKKGDVTGVARLAGIMAAKRTSELIPLCHPLPLDHVDVELTLGTDHLEIIAEATTTGRTGVEMEALTAATVAALTVYDMAKALDRSMRITDIELLEKIGGKSGHWVRPTDP